MATTSGISQALSQFLASFCTIANTVWSTAGKYLHHILDFLRKFLSLLWSLSSWFMRRFELASTIIDQQNLPSEPLKKAIEKDRWKALASCGKHFLPVGITIYLLILNFAQVFWETPGIRGQNARLNALQLAAKIHELLVISSLSLIVLHFIQSELFRGGGIPMGGIFSAFQITDISSLWKPGFWAAATTKEKNTRSILLVLLVVLSITIGALSGPSSAILMQPCLDWWTDVLSASEIKASFVTDTKFFVNLPAYALWPNEINASNFFPLDCNVKGPQVPIHCPAGGIPDLLAWNIAQIPFGGPYNVTVSSGQYSRFLQGAVDKPSHGISVTLVSQSASALVNMMLPNILNAMQSGAPPKSLPYGSIGAPRALNAPVQPSEITRWLVSDLNGAGLLAPQTFAYCNIQTYDELQPSFERNGSFDNELHFPLKGATSASQNNDTWSVPFPQALLDMWRANNIFAARWVEPPDAGARTPSIGIAFMANKSYESYGDGITPEVYVETCSISAGWWEVEAYLDTTDAYVHAPSINDPEQTVNDWVLEKNNASKIRQVKLDVNWANNALTPNETLGRIYSAFRLLRSPSPSAAFGPIVSMLVTDALARFGMETSLTLGDVIVFSDGTRTRSNGSVLTASNATPFKLTRLHYGYSYSMRGITRQLAAGLLLVHVLVALIHSGLAFGHGRVYSFFATLPGILAFAINSDFSQALGNTCAGIARMDTYRLVIKVKEVADSHLGLVINNEGQYPALEEGKQYGSRLQPTPKQLAFS